MYKIAFPILLFVMATACQQPTMKTSAVQHDSTSSASGFQPSTVEMTGELPSVKAVPALFDEMDFQQATQAYLWALPLVEFAQWQYAAAQSFGATDNDIVVYTSYEDKLAILTANATTPYFVSFMDLGKNGPTVIEMPAGHTAGGLSDFWQREIGTIGEMGPDKGKGGKYVLVPPGTKDFKAPGCYVITSPMMHVFFGFRALDPDPKVAQELVKGIKIYPYKDRDKPATTRVLSPQSKRWDGIQPDGLDYWKRVHDVLDEEPVEERDRFILAWLDNLGLKKGQLFSPDERQKKILIAAAERGKLMAMANSFSKRFPNNNHWPDRRWDYILVMSDPSQRAANFEEFFQRASYFYEAVTYSKAMITKVPGVGQAYLGTYKDQNGDWLDGAKNYTLHVPANAPAANFWSITVYDAATRCLIDNSTKNADLSSRKDLLKNDDGSYDLYFGPQAPAGKEKNWIQTVAGKHWFVYMRFYGPTQAYFDKSWKMGDIEQTK